jgi:hypothetical protein
MSLANYILTVQTGGSPASGMSNPDSSWYFVFAVVALVLGLVVLVFIRSSARRSSRR